MKGKNMKARILFLAVFFMLVIAAGYAQEKISAKDAGNYIGKTVTVVDTVNQVYKSKKGDYFLDMGGDYPDNAFTAVIFSGDASNFDSLESYEGKVIEVTGKVKEYQGKVEIIVKNKEQININKK